MCVFFTIPSLANRRPLPSGNRLCVQAFLPMRLWRWGQSRAGYLLGRFQIVLSVLFVWHWFVDISHRCCKLPVFYSFFYDLHSNILYIFYNRKKITGLTCTMHPSKTLSGNKIGHSVLACKGIHQFTLSSNSSCNWETKANKNLLMWKKCTVSTEILCPYLQRWAKNCVLP